MSARADNVRVPLVDLQDFCRAMGHDPDRVAAIHITPKTVTVEYVHLVTQTEPGA